MSTDKKCGFCNRVLERGLTMHMRYCKSRPVEHRDDVNHPRHYTSHPSGVECIVIVEHMPFCVGNAIKYLWRSGLKEAASEMQDLEKAAWYVQREIARRRALDGK